MDAPQKNTFFYATVVAIGGFLFGLDAALISGTINFLTQEFSLTDWQVGTAVSAPGLGVLIALPIAGYASDLLGRKKTLLIIAGLYLISALGSALAPNYGMLVAARLLGGLAFSSITLASMYIGEIAPAKWRGQLVSMTQINIVIGLSAAYFINYLILQLTHSEAAWVDNLGIRTSPWRWMLGTEILPAMLWMLMLLFIPRSPYWLLLKGKQDEAEAALRKMNPPGVIPQKIAEIQESLAQISGPRSLGSQFKKIFGRPMRLTLIIAATIAIAQQATGINAVLFYAPTIFEQLGIGTDAAFMQAIWIGLTGLVFTALALWLIDKLGRRPLMIWGMLWIVASLAICSLGFHLADYSLSREAISEWPDQVQQQQLEPLVGTVFGSDTAFKLAVQEALGESAAREQIGTLLQKAANLNTTLILLGILSFIAAFHFSVGPIMWVLLSEIFPISVRGIAIPLFALLSSVINYLVQQFFPWQLAQMGSAAIFLFYASMVAIGLLVLFRFLPETKNLSIEEVQKILQREKAEQKPVLQ
ncbi:MAG: MFS transporter [Bacteroidota bacterium]